MAAPPPTYSLEKIGPGAASLALLTAVLWGGNQVAIKVGLEGMPPLAMAAARFGIGWLVVAAAAVLTRRRVAADTSMIRRARRSAGPARVRETCGQSGLDRHTNEDRWVTME